MSLPPVDLEPFALSTMLAMPFAIVNLASFLNLIPSLDVDLNVLGILTAQVVMSA